MKIDSGIDYDSKDGMLTTVWGPAMWHSLHTISFNYPANPTLQQKKEYKEFFLSLQNVLPCGACRENLKKNLKEVPLTPYALKNRKNFSRWLYRLHEQVNDMLKKPKETRLTYEQVRDRYESFRARCSLKESMSKTGPEPGCVEPMGGVKSKCVISIVPKNYKTDTFNMASVCYLKKYR